MPIIRHNNHPSRQSTAPKRLRQMGGRRYDIRLMPRALVLRRVSRYYFADTIIPDAKVSFIKDGRLGFEFCVDSTMYNYGIDTK